MDSAHLYNGFVISQNEIHFFSFKQRSESMKKITTIGIDLAKNVFQLHMTDQHGNKIDEKRLSRNKLIEFLANTPGCLIGIEACGGAHYWARKFQELGHEVKMMAPQFVKPYVKSNKNDCNDARGIAEAVTRSTMRFVSVKTPHQQDIQSIHRVREGIIKHKLCISNQIRGLLAEYGIVFPEGFYALRSKLPMIIDDNQNELTSMSRELFRDLLEQFHYADEKLKFYDKKIILLAKENETCQRIMAIEGVGPITATAIVATVGDATAFKNGREMSAWLGLVPRHVASGEKKRLLGITKRGDSYLRKLLIQGGRSLILSSRCKQDKRSLWILNKYANSGFNKTAVAVANKNTRIIWALLSKKEDYKQAA